MRHKSILALAVGWTLIATSVAQVAWAWPWSTSKKAAQQSPNTTPWLNQKKKEVRPQSVLAKATDGTSKAMTKLQNAFTPKPPKDHQVSSYPVARRADSKTSWTPAWLKSEEPRSSKSVKEFLQADRVAP